MNITISKENYLKTIAEAESEGEAVISATLARWLGITPPAVTAGLSRLKRDGLVRVLEGGRITLTKPGRTIADKILSRHHLIERMLTEMFGMEWYKVHEEAERMEHAVSEEFEQRLISVLGTGGACPHGNMVSSDTPKDRRERGWTPLAEVQAPGHFAVACVYERDRKLLEFLDGLGLRPGVCFMWEGRNYDETVGVIVRKKKVTLGSMAAQRMWVKPAPVTPDCGCAAGKGKTGRD